MAKIQAKRKDKDRIVLKKGESQRANGSYDFRWTDENGKRRCIYAKTLEELREMEKQIAKDSYDEIKTEARFITINEMYDLWKNLKKGVRNNTFENYKYMYETFVRHTFGQKRISTLKKSDVKKFYNYLADERELKASTIDGIHTVLHQVLQLAVDDCYIRHNPSDNVLKELKKSHFMKGEKKKALTKAEQELLLKFLSESEIYSHWYPIFAVMAGTGLRVGEVTGLRWCDIDLDEGIIDVNHTLVYYAHRAENSKNGCYFNINKPKTPASIRRVPMLGMVKEAFLMERENQEKAGIKCRAVIDGYSDFIFVNKNGDTQHQGTLNKAIRRIIRDCNDNEFLKCDEPETLLPHFSCHTLRHSFATRMSEAGVAVKVMQDILGHTDVATTLNIYTDATPEHKKSEFVNLDKYFKEQ